MDGAVAKSRTLEMKGARMSGSKVSTLSSRRGSGNCSRRCIAPRETSRSTSHQETRWNSRIWITRPIASRETPPSSPEKIAQSQQIDVSGPGELARRRNTESNQSHLAGIKSRAPDLRVARYRSDEQRRIAKGGRSRHRRCPPPNPPHHPPPPSCAPLLYFPTYG